MKIFLAFWWALAAAAIEPCAGFLVQTPDGIAIDARTGQHRLRSGDILEIGYDDGRLEHALIRVHGDKVYLPAFVEGKETERLLDDEWLGRILHARIEGRYYGRVRHALFAREP